MLRNFSLNEIFTTESQRTQRKVRQAKRSAMNEMTIAESMVAAIRGNIQSGIFFFGISSVSSVPLW